MGRTRRVVLIVGLSVVGLFAIGWLGLQAYLSSSSAKSLAASRLSDIFGLPVEIQKLNVGMGSSSLGFRISDPNAPHPEDVVQVESAHADVSLTDLATGNVAPSEVVLQGLALRLRVGKDNKILTTLPATGDSSANVGTIPAVRLDGGSISIRQEGRPEFRLGGIQATLTPRGGHLDLAGSIRDPKWGHWDIRGEVNPQAGSGRVELSTADGPLVPELLTSVPFIPEPVWRFVDASGRCGVKITLAYAKESNFTYEVLLTPRDADLRIPELGIPLHQVAGTVRIVGTRVELLGATAELAGGPFQVNGELNFDPEPAILRFAIQAHGVDVRKLPADWNVPRQFDGQLRGEAKLEIRIHADGRVETLGGGDGVIENARFLGEKAEIRLKLRSADGRYQFQSEKPVSARPVFRDRGLLSHPVAVLLACATLVQPAKDAPDSTVLSASLTLRDVDIAQVLEKLHVKLGYAITGQATLEATVAVPVGDAGQSRAYRIDGRLTAARLSFEGLEVRNLTAAMLYTDGKLTLSNFTAELPPEPGGTAPGSLRGTANAAFDPPGLVTARFDISRVPVGQVLRAVPGPQLDISGTVSGRVTFVAPAVKLGELAAWDVTTELESEQLMLFGRTARAARFHLAVEQGKARLQDLSARVEGIPVSAVGMLDLVAPYPFQATLQTSPREVGTLQKLFPEVSIPVAVEGRLAIEAAVQGSLSPLKYEAKGSVTAPQLKAGRHVAEKIAFPWILTPERFRVPSLTAAVFQGSITGSADIPLAPNAAGRFVLTFKNVDSSAVSATFPELPVRLTGLVSGAAQSIIPPAVAGKPRAFDASLTLDAPRLTIQGIPAEKLTGQVNVVGGAIDYKLEGHVLGGTFDISGKYPTASPRSAPNDAPMEQGSVHLRGLELSRLIGAFGFDARAALGGRFDLSFGFSADFRAGSGRFVLRRLLWGNARLASEVSGLLRLHERQLELSEVSGVLAGGILRARGRLSLDEHQRGFAALSLSGADAGPLFGSMLGDPDAVRGAVSLSFHGRFGDDFRGTGHLYIPRGELYGLEATELRLPFEVSTGALGYGKFLLRDAEGRLGGGRVTGNLAYEWGFAAHVGGTVRFTDVRIGGIVRALSTSTRIGNGRVSGRFDVAGTQVRSVNDLTGQLTARLVQTSVREIPVLRHTTHLLSPRAGTDPFEEGDVRGRLANGVFRISRLALVSPSAKFFACGTVTLAGRLDLNVVAMTGQLGLTGGPLGRLTAIVPAVGPVPLSAITAASEFLSNRTIRLQITGTVGHPSVRVNAPALLAEEAVRFLLRTYTPFDPANPIGGAVGAAVASPRD